MILRLGQLFRFRNGMYTKFWWNRWVDESHSKRFSALFEKGEQVHVDAFYDANWAGLVNQMRSTSGYCTFVGGNLVP